MGLFINCFRLTKELWWEKPFHDETVSLSALSINDLNLGSLMSLSPSAVSGSKWVLADMTFFEISFRASNVSWRFRVYSFYLDEFYCLVSWILFGKRMNEVLIHFWTKASMDEIFHIPATETTHCLSFHFLFVYQPTDKI